MMILYLAGLKGVDPSLREASSLDGANEWQTFKNVIFPTLRPTNTVVLVVTIIESLRAFDLVFVFNGGRTRLTVVIVTNNIIGESSRIGYGSAIASSCWSSRSVVIVVSGSPSGRSGDRERPATLAAGARKRREPVRPARVLLHVFLAGTSLAWLAPLLWAVFSAAPAPTRRRRAMCPGRTRLTSTTSRTRSNSRTSDYFVNTLLIAVPAVLLTLFLSSMVAFYVAASTSASTSRCWVFPAANLLPQQVIITPLYRMYLRSTCPGSGRAASCTTPRSAWC